MDGGVVLSCHRQVVGKGFLGLALGKEPLLGTVPEGRQCPHRVAECQYPLLSQCRRRGSSYLFDHGHRGLRLGPGFLQGTVLTSQTA